MDTTVRPAVSPDRLFQFAFGFAPPLILQAALHHRIFDVLSTGAKNLDEVSVDTGASTRGLRAILDALVGLDLLAKDTEGRYHLTAESAAYLVSTEPSFLGGYFRHISRHQIPSWLPINEVVQTGRPAVSTNQEAAGADFFHQFVEDLFPMNYPAALALGQVLELSRATAPVRVLDIAAGSSVWGIALAQQSPHVRVTALDWPDVIPLTKRVVARFGLEERFSYVGGDVLTADFGMGYHVAVLGHILHTEGEVRSRALLRKTFEALAPGGTVVVAEMLANDERTGPPHALIFAVNMLVNSEHGSTYSFRDIAEWLTEAGFVRPHSVGVPAPSPLVLATRTDGK